MSDVSKTIDQLEATVGAVTYAAVTNDETQRDIAELFVTLRSQLDIHSGLPVDSPLRTGNEPETLTVTNVSGETTISQGKKTKK